MRKFLLLLLVLIVGAGAYFYFNLGSFVEGMMEEEGTIATGTDVQVGEVEFNAAEGRMTLRNVSVANPAGFSEPLAFAVDEITVRLSYSEISSNRLLVVEEVFVDNPLLVYEKANGTTNLDVIKNNASGGGSSSSGDTDGLKMIVSKIEFTDGQIKALGLSPSQPKLEAKMPGFVIKDIGRAEGGVSPEEVAKRVTVRITGRVIEAVLAGSIFGAITDPVGTVTNPLKGVLGGGK